MLLLLLTMAMSTLLLPMTMPKLHLPLHLPLSLHRRLIEVSLGLNDRHSLNSKHSLSKRLSISRARPRPKNLCLLLCLHHRQPDNEVGREVAELGAHHVVDAPPLPRATTTHTTPPATVTLRAL